MKVAQVPLVDRDAIAERLSDMRCPAEGCHGVLLRCAGVLLTGESAKPYTNQFGEHIPHPEVQPWHIGCDGTPMHVWTKESLFMLRPALTALVEEPGEPNNA